MSRSYAGDMGICQVQHPSTSRATLLAGARGGLAQRLSDAWVRLARLRRWEFWPSWMIYAPLVPFVVVHAVRHRGFGTCTAVNPAIEFGGLVGESKSQILAMLPAERIASAALVAAGPVEQRMAAVDGFMRANGISWPVILKPDVGERGTGVRLIQDAAAAREYLTRYSQPAIVQRYHPGPHEVGVFYIRRPTDKTGELFSITDKRFAKVTGDGVSTLSQLIRSDARLRLQLDVFLQRLGTRWSEIPASGVVVPLGISGNHCRGSLFLDGSALATTQLREAFDTISLATPGLYFGRFDVRYHDAAELKAGRGFAIIEFNGLLSEPTHMYDPGFSFWAAQRLLRRQWRMAFEIGAENCRRGAIAPGWRELIAAVRIHTRRPDADAPSD